MPQAPALVLGVTLASVYALLFHLWKGEGLGRKGWRDLLFMWLAAVVGFASGQLVGQLWGFIPWTIGQIHIIEATLVALLFLIVARWLASERNVA
ncbi:MAG TPA: hypothetical protein VLC95_09880 [Anaerolineae bacterium]|nr:hypothetical protein [Anaerolineae bacterium]